MKFKKDGKVFESADEALDNAFDCSDCENAAGCPVGREGMMHGVDCCTYVEAYPAEAARLMGYEVVEDNCLESDVIKQEVNMDKQKPRICEVLGVEVGEEWTIGDTIYRINENGKREYWHSGGWQAGCCEFTLCDAINHPESIIRKPRFTEEEVADARAIVRLFGPDGWTHIGKTEDGYPQLEDKDEESEIVVANVGISSNLFPSILPGTSVLLKEITECQDS